MFLHCFHHAFLAGADKFSHDSTPLITADWSTYGQLNQGGPVRVPENFLPGAETWHHSFSILRFREKWASAAERDSLLHSCCRPATSLPLLNSPFPVMREIPASLQVSLFFLTYLELGFCYLQTSVLIHS